MHGAQQLCFLLHACLAIHRGRVIAQETRDLARVGAGFLR